MEDRLVREFTRIGANEEGVNISLAYRQGNNFTACGEKG